MSKPKSTTKKCSKIKSTKHHRSILVSKTTMSLVLATASYTIHGCFLKLYRAVKEYIAEYQNTRDTKFDQLNMKIDQLSMKADKQSEQIDRQSDQIAELLFLSKDNGALKDITNFKEYDVNNKEKKTSKKRKQVYDETTMTVKKKRSIKCVRCQLQKKPCDFQYPCKRCLNARKNDMSCYYELVL